MIKLFLLLPLLHKMRCKMASDKLFCRVVVVPQVVLVLADVFVVAVAARLSSRRQRCFYC